MTSFYGPLLARRIVCMMRKGWSFHCGQNHTAVRRPDVPRTVHRFCTAYPLDISYQDLLRKLDGVEFDYRFQQLQGERA